LRTGIFWKGQGHVAPDPTLAGPPVYERAAVWHSQISIPGGGTTTIKQYLADNYNYQYSWIGPVIGILCGFMVFFGALAILSLKFINYQRR
jgi:hypothetical protein